MIWSFVPFCSIPEEYNTIRDKNNYQNQLILYFYCPIFSFISATVNGLPHFFVDKISIERIFSPNLDCYLMDNHHPHHRHFNSTDSVLSLLEMSNNGGNLDYASFDYIIHIVNGR